MKAPVKPLLQLCFLLMVFSCKKPYTPAITASNPGYLVVEGVVNSGSDTTVINLSRTVSLGDSKVNSPETGAKVIVESSKNDQYALAETIAGTYVAINLNLPTDRTYRLHIFTSKNKEYASDFVKNMITPPVDSVYGVPDKAGVQFYVSTHDAANNTGYYRWSYSESWTYLIDPAEQSEWDFVNNQIVPRSTANLISNTCYKFGPASSNIFLGASHLAQAAVSKAPLGYVAASTGRLAGTFSLTVKQYALTGEAYTFWNLLKTNSEQLGTLFDAQPSSSVTNIHSVTNPDEPVVGYASVSTVATKKIFLSGRTLPLAVETPPILPLECLTKYIPVDPIATFQSRLQQTFGSGDSIIINAVTIYHTTTILGYDYAAKNCLDCQTSGGTNVTPPDWPPL